MVQARLGDERFVLNGVSYWLRFPDAGGALGFSSSTPFAPKTQTGERTYEDFDPLSAVALTDLSGGMGQDRLVEPTKYFDAVNIDARGGRLVLGPQLHESTDLLADTPALAYLEGVHDPANYGAGSHGIAYIGVGGVQDIVSATVLNTGPTINVDRVWLPLKATLEHGTVTVRVYRGTTVIATTTVDSAWLGYGGAWAPAPFSTPWSFLAGETVHIAVYHSGAVDDLNWLAISLVDTATPNTDNNAYWLNPDTAAWESLGAYCFPVWFNDPERYFDRPMRFLTGAGLDGVSRVWAFAGQCVYYADAEGMFTPVQDGSGAVMRLGATITDAKWYQGAPDTAPALYIALGLDTDMVKFDGNVGTEVWTTLTGKRATQLCVAAGWLFCSDNGNELTATDGTNWALYLDDVGSSTYAIRNLCAWQGTIYAGKDSGLWKITIPATYITSGHLVAEEVVSLASESNSANFAAMTVHNGDLYFTVGNGFFRYTTSGVLSSIGPESGTERSISERGVFRWAVSSLSTLWCGVEGTLPTGNGAICGYTTVLSYAAGEWNPVVNPLRVGDLTRGACFDPGWYDSVPRLWFGAGLHAAYVRMPTGTQRRWLWEGMDWAATGSLRTSWIDGNLRTFDKDWVSLDIDAHGLVADSGDALTVGWRSSEDVAFTVIGSVSADGITRIDFPASTYGSKCQLEITLTRGTVDGGASYHTPHVEALVLRYLVRPPDARMFTRTYEFSTHATWRNGVAIGLNLDQQIARLETLRESAEPLLWFTWTGGAYLAHIVDYNAAERREVKGDLQDTGTTIVSVRLLALRRATAAEILAAG